MYLDLFRAADVAKLVVLAAAAAAAAGPRLGVVFGPDAQAQLLHLFLAMVHDLQLRAFGDLPLPPTGRPRNPKPNTVTHSRSTGNHAPKLSCQGSERRKE